MKILSRGNKVKTYNTKLVILISPNPFFFSRIISKNSRIEVYKTIIVLPPVLYVCETCSLALKNEHMLRLFKNRIQRRIFGTRRDQNGEWRFTIRNFIVYIVHII